jgi:hypothetical protein
VQEIEAQILSARPGITAINVRVMPRGGQM